MSGKKNQVEDGTVVTPQIQGDLQEQIATLTGERDGLLKVVEEVSADRDKIFKDLNTVGNELNSANELIVTQDAQIDHLKSIVLEFESAKGLTNGTKVVTDVSITPFNDLKATLDQHPEHKTVYVKETAGGQNFAFSFRKPKDIENWIEKSREEILGL